MELDQEHFPSGNLAAWNMTIPSHDEYMVISKSFANQLICHPLSNSTIDIAEAAGQRIHDLSSYCDRLRMNVNELQERLDLVITVAIGEKE